jgi:hypothetical protein
MSKCFSTKRNCENGWTAMMANVDIYFSGNALFYLRNTPKYKEELCAGKRLQSKLKLADGFSRYLSTISFSSRRQ